MPQHRLRYPNYVYRLVKEHPNTLQEAKLSHKKDDEADKKQATASQSKCIFNHDHQAEPDMCIY